MKNRYRLILTTAAAAVLLISAATDASARMKPAAYDVVLEAGAVQPQADLKADFTTPAGFEAGTGYTIGARFRQRFVNGWAISPSFQYVQFGKYLGDLPEDGGPFESGASMYRYGVDLQYFFPARRNAPRLFLTGGAALINNRMREDYLDSGDFYKESVNSLAFSGGAGLQTGNFEFLLQYHLNRFDTKRFYPGSDSYEWDYLSLQVGIGLPSRY